MATTSVPREAMLRMMGVNAQPYNITNINTNVVDAYTHFVSSTYKGGFRIYVLMKQYRGDFPDSLDGGQTINYSQSNAYYFLDRYLAVKNELKAQLPGVPIYWVLTGITDKMKFIKSQAGVTVNDTGDMAEYSHGMNPNTEAAYDEINLIRAHFAQHICNDEDVVEISNETDAGDNDRPGRLHMTPQQQACQQSNAFYRIKAVAPNVKVAMGSIWTSPQYFIDMAEHCQVLRGQNNYLCWDEFNVHIYDFSNSESNYLTALNTYKAANQAYGNLPMVLSEFGLDSPTAIGSDLRAANEASRAQRLWRYMELAYQAGYYRAHRFILKDEKAVGDPGLRFDECGDHTQGNVKKQSYLDLVDYVNATPSVPGITFKLLNKKRVAIL
ncbi:MAG: hypothetical protein INR69_18505 [Mucilaginibacter polytrichastri]|nr:hypothetical protein [Mucilaginibacter polytrichastri]